MNQSRRSVAAILNAYLSSARLLDWSTGRELDCTAARQSIEITGHFSASSNSSSRPQEGRSPCVEATQSISEYSPLHWNPVVRSMYRSERNNFRHRRWRDIFFRCHHRFRARIRTPCDCWAILGSRLILAQYDYF